MMPTNRGKPVPKPLLKIIKWTGIGDDAISERQQQIVAPAERPARVPASADIADVIQF
jgi:hypothetical protein